MYIADGVQTVGSSAVETCSSLPEIYFPDSVTSIGEYSLKNCSSLLKMYVGSNLKSIPNEAMSHSFFDTNGGDLWYYQLYGYYYIGDAINHMVRSYRIVFD